MLGSALSVGSRYGGVHLLWCQVAAVNPVDRVCGSELACTGLLRLSVRDECVSYAGEGCVWYCFFQALSCPSPPLVACSWGETLRSNPTAFEVKLDLGQPNLGCTG